jgi:uncharacterized protein (TIGR02646 family)
MEWIRKSLPPKLFQLWYLHEKPFPKSWDKLPSTKKEEVKREKGIYYYSKEELRTFLFNEQNKRCGYCNQIIRNDESSPVEHLEPRKYHPTKRFDYYNLILSCDGNVKRETDVHVHCDNLKDKKEIPIFPTQKKCEKLFIYDEFGNIFSKSVNGKKVIEVLGLNCPFLKNKREEILLDYVYNNQLYKKTSNEYKQSYLEILANDNIEFKNQILSVLLNFMDKNDKKQCINKSNKMRLIKGIKILIIKILGYISYKTLDLRIKRKQKNVF